MLSLEHPEVMDLLKKAGAGLWPMKRMPDEVSVLATKTSLDFIRAAKHLKKISFHLYDITGDQGAALGVITAAYDQKDAPVVIKTVATELVLTKALLDLFEREVLSIHFFDMKCAELYGGNWTLTIPSKIDFLKSKFLENCSTIPIHNMPDYYEKLALTYASGDDGIEVVANQADISVPENLVIMQITEGNFNSAGSFGQGIIESKLDDNETPGEAQEQEILLCLSRVYDVKNIYLNPNLMNGKEFCDVLAIGKHEAIVVQAKTIMHQEKLYNETEARRHRRLRKLFDKALNQTVGAEKAFYKFNALVHYDGRELEISSQSKLLIHIILVPEKPPALLEEWSKGLAGIDLAQTPIVVLDMSELNNASNRYEDRQEFCAAMFTIRDAFVIQKRIGNYNFYDGKLASH